MSHTGCHSELLVNRLVSWHRPTTSLNSQEQPRILQSPVLSTVACWFKTHKLPRSCSCLNNVTFLFSWWYSIYQTNATTNLINVAKKEALFFRHLLGTAAVSQTNSCTVCLNGPVNVRKKQHTETPHHISQTSAYHWNPSGFSSTKIPHRVSWQTLSFSLSLSLPPFISFSSSLYKQFLFICWGGCASRPQV